jgi:large conductance mechanosensitive channel
MQVRILVARAVPLLFFHPRHNHPSNHNSEEHSVSFVSEFKAFAMRGNVIDLAVGVIIGGAFGKIVDSMVKDLIMPVVSWLFGGLDFSNYFILLGSVPAQYKGGMTYAELTAAGVPLFAWGNFVTIALNFLILAVVIFTMVKQVNRLRQSAEHQPPAEPPAPVTPEDIVLLREIRDALRNPR